MDRGSQLPPPSTITIPNLPLNATNKPLALSKAVSMPDISTTKKPSIASLFPASNIPDLRQFYTQTKENVQYISLPKTSAFLPEETKEELAARQEFKGVSDALIRVMNKSCVGELDTEDFCIRSNLLAKILVDECDATGTSYESMKSAFTCAITHLTTDMELQRVDWKNSLEAIELEVSWENAKLLFAKAEKAFERIVRSKIDGSE